MHAPRGTHRALAVAIVAAALLLVAGCKGKNGSADSTITIDVTDTPVDSAQHVVVAFTAVELEGPNGTVTEQLSSEQSVDLLNLQGGASARLLDGVTADAGDYQSIRFDIDPDNSYIVLNDGNTYPLQAPAGSDNGLQLATAYTVAQGANAGFAVDFDLRKSLTRTYDRHSGRTQYTLSPAMRMVDEQQAGTIKGTAAATVIIGRTSIGDPGCSPAVYVFQGSSVTPEGFYVTMDGGTPPLTSADLALDTDTGAYDYTAPYLAAGTYTLAATCAAHDRDGADSLAFTATQTVDVTAGATTTLDFQ